MEKLVRKALKKYRRPTGRWSKDWILKVFSLFFAIIMWYFVVGEDTVDQTIFVPIEITNLPRDLVISNNQFKKQLEVTVSGPRGLVRSVTSQHVARSIDLAGAKPGNKVIHNKADSINFPRGLKVQRIQPANITLMIDRLLEKELPIKSVTKGKPAEGFEVISIKTDPQTLSLTAPAGVLSEEIFLSTQPIDISGTKATLTKQVQLDIKPEIAELIGEPVISVTVVVREKRSSREFQNIPVELNHSGERTIYHLNQHLISVKTELPYHLAAQNPSEFKFKATIEALNLPPGKYQLPINVVATPPEVKVLETTPEKISVDISPSGPIMKHLLYGETTVTVQENE